MFDQFSEKQMMQIFGLIAFISVFAALFIYFALFPVTQDIYEVENKVTIGVDPLALETAKLWNSSSQSETVINIDSCNKATRVSEFVWQVELKPC